MIAAEQAASPPTSTGSLLEVAEPLLREAASLRDGRIAAAQGDGLRERARQTLERLRERGLAAGLGDAALADAERAVVAFLDEAVIASAHPERAAWLAQPLQVERLGERASGQRFFQRLEGPREQAPPAAVLELYLACLWLGFQGVHALEDQALLDAHRHRLGEWLADRTPAAPPPPPASAGTDRGAGQHVGWFWSAVAVLALAALAYLHTGVQVERAAEAAAEEIEAAREVLRRGTP
ncbi:DotU family type IV/VI secretion system protein [Halorhodospira halophila]|uniref:Type IV / VI secretion system DotU domain-containing protein n=1 Tax=Halorhodospira halophila (strain DSM 244 / SL1) TaxID=349124 RepID=A1WTE6_HALHL|nr:DotU family type IV/VI secretion system protein [Halorhodospira halophila]ABM60958.1 conserved hypothetical protein [Halorhodospira halophila SL1]MBK1728616.1 DotU family type IV/VI secretion system protein [Halorhodospira halophila]